MLSDFTVKKESFFDLKKAFFKVQKMAFFSKGLTHAFGQYFLYLNLIKISLEIVLSDFAEKKETFFDLKKQHFSKSKKSHFLKGINPCFWPKNAIFFFT